MDEELFNEFREAFRPALKELRDVEPGARVRKLDAWEIDYAFNREGQVCRDGGRVGIWWEGRDTIIQYPGETKVVLVADHDRIVAEFNARHPR